MKQTSRKLNVRTSLKLHKYFMNFFKIPVSTPLRPLLFIALLHTLKSTCMKIILLQSPGLPLYYYVVKTCGFVITISRATTLLLCGYNFCLTKRCLRERNSPFSLGTLFHCFSFRRFRCCHGKRKS